MLVRTRMNGFRCSGNLMQIMPNHHPLVDDTTQICYAGLLSCIHSLRQRMALLGRHRCCTFHHKEQLEITGRLNQQIQT